MTPRNGTAVEHLINIYQLELSVFCNAMLDICRQHVSLQLTLTSTFSVENTFYPRNNFEFLDTQRSFQKCTGRGWQKPKEVDVRCKIGGKFFWYFCLWHKKIQKISSPIAIVGLSIAVVDCRLHSLRNDRYFYLYQKTI